MSKIENNKQAQRIKAFSLAEIAAALSIIWFILCFFFSPAFPYILLLIPFFFFEETFPHVNPFYFLVIYFVVEGIPSILAMVALLRIKMSRRRLGGRGAAIFAIVLNLFVIIVPVVRHYLAHPPIATNRVVCNGNLRQLSVAMLSYTDEHKQYPTPENWCDLLMESGMVRKMDFCCPEDIESEREQLCSYSMNPNARPNSAPDMVLLFESKPGWNQVGGKELLNAENHEGKGANISFNDYSVKFVRTYDFNDLKWSDETKH